MPTIGLSMTIVLGAAERTSAPIRGLSSGGEPAWLAARRQPDRSAAGGEQPAASAASGPRRRKRIWTVPSLTSSAVRSYRFISRTR